MSSGLLDTGVFIAREVARPLGQLPDRVAISVINLGELELGVLAADDGEVQARRADTLALARESDPIPVSQSVMTAWAHLVKDCRRAGLEGTAEDRLLIQVAVGTGLRWSELTALQVRDLELTGPVASLSVCRAWKRNPRGEFAVAGAGAYCLGTPKAKKSRRRITLSPAVVALLRQTIDGKQVKGLVFTAPQGGPLNQPTFYEDRWKKAVRLAQQA